MSADAWEDCPGCNRQSEVRVDHEFFFNPKKERLEIDYAAVCRVCGWSLTFSETRSFEVYATKGGK